MNLKATDHALTSANSIAKSAWMRCRYLGTGTGTDVSSWVSFIYFLLVSIFHGATVNYSHSAVTALRTDTT